MAQQDVSNVPNAVLQSLLTRLDHIEFGLVRKQTQKIEEHAQTLGSIQKARRMQLDEDNVVAPAPMPLPAPATPWVVASHRGPGDRSPSIIPIDSPSQERRWGIASPGAGPPAEPCASAQPMAAEAATCIARMNLLEEVDAKQQESFRQSLAVRLAETELSAENPETEIGTLLLTDAVLKIACMTTMSES